MSKAPKKTKAKAKAPARKKAPAPAKAEAPPAPPETTEENVPEQQQALDAVSEAADTPAEGELVDQSSLEDRNDDPGAPPLADEQEQAEAAVAAAEPKKAQPKFKKDQEIEVRLKLPGMVPIAVRRVRFADLRNGALSDKLVREMLHELESQF